MTKNNFLTFLQTLLDEYVMDNQIKEDIIKDYDSLWLQYEELGMDPQSIIHKLGQPKDIIGELTEGYIKKETKLYYKKKSFNNKLIALTPFIALVLFFMIGFLVPNGFIYAWQTFLLIPMSAIILEGPKKNLEKLTALSPFIALILFFSILGFGFNLWHPGWMIFLIIPIIGGLNHPSILKRVLISGGLFVTAILYLMIDQLSSFGVIQINANVSLPYSLFVFIPVLIVILYEWLKNILKNGWMYLILLVISTALYFYISIAFDLWVISWLVFFSIPIYAIMKQAPKKDKIIALMPFISTSLFMILGYFFNVWAFAWLVFLLIPVVAIIQGK